MKIETDINNLINDCLSYGEIEIAQKISLMDQSTLEKIFIKAGDYAVQLDPISKKPMLLAKALTLAAVELVEGSPRNLLHSRRDFSLVNKSKSK